MHHYYYIASFHHIASCGSAVQSDNSSCKRTFSLRKWTSCNVCFKLPVHPSIVTVTLVTIICCFQPSSQIGSSHLRLTVKSCLIIHTLFSVPSPVFKVPVIVFLHLVRGSCSSCHCLVLPPFWSLVPRDLWADRGRPIVHVLAADKSSEESFVTWE